MLLCVCTAEKRLTNTFVLSAVSIMVRCLYGSVTKILKQRKPLGSLYNVTVLPLIPNLGLSSPLVTENNRALR